jgi:hypothetical protein
LYNRYTLQKKKGKILGDHDRGYGLPDLDDPRFEPYHYDKGDDQMNPWKINKKFWFQDFEAMDKFRVLFFDQIKQMEHKDEPIAERFVDDDENRKRVYENISVVSKPYLGGYQIQVSTVVNNSNDEDFLKNICRSSIGAFENSLEIEQRIGKINFQFIDKLRVGSSLKDEINLRTSNTCISVATTTFFQIERAASWGQRHGSILRISELELIAGIRYVDEDYAPTGEIIYPTNPQNIYFIDINRKIVLIVCSDHTGLIGRFHGKDEMNIFPIIFNFAPCSNGKDLEGKVWDIFNKQRQILYEERGYWHTAPEGISHNLNDYLSYDAIDELDKYTLVLFEIVNSFFGNQPDSYTLPLIYLKEALFGEDNLSKIAEKEHVDDLKNLFADYPVSKRQLKKNNIKTGIITAEDFDFNLSRFSTLLCFLIGGKYDFRFDVEVTCVLSLGQKSNTIEKSRKLGAMYAQKLDIADVESFEELYGGYSPWEVTDNVRTFSRIERQSAKFRDKFFNTYNQSKVSKRELGVMVEKIVKTFELEMTENSSKNSFSVLCHTKLQMPDFDKISSKKLQKFKSDITESIALVESLGITVDFH